MAMPPPPPGMAPPWGPPQQTGPALSPAAVPLAGGMLQQPGTVISPGFTPPAAAAMPSDSQVIVVISGKGGVGTTVLAINIALLDATEAKRRVGIIDFDLQHGDVRRMLRVDAPEGILELFRLSPQVDREALASRLVAGPSGIKVLLSPPRPSLDADLSPEFVAALLLQLRFLVQDVIVDMSPHITTASIAALRSADKIVLVSSMSDPGVRATQGMLRLFAEIGVNPQNVIPILNRTEANSDLTKPAVEEAIGRSVPVQMPYDPILVGTSVNRGAPFVTNKPDSQASRKLREFAGLLFPLPQASLADAAHSGAPVQQASGPMQQPQSTYGFDDDEPRRKKKGLFRK